MAEILVIVSLSVYVAMIVLVVATVVSAYKCYSRNMASACLLHDRLSIEDSLSPKLLHDRLSIEDSLSPKMYGIMVLKSKKRWQNKRR